MIPLTPRQSQIVELLLEGLSNKEIARALGISNGTVKCHLHIVFDKLAGHGINSRGKLAAYYYGHPEVSRPTPDTPPAAPAARSPRPR